VKSGGTQVLGVKFRSDMEGFKLTYVMGDMLTLFKVSSQCEVHRFLP
jgi:hypothetical protein